MVILAVLFRMELSCEQTIRRRGVCAPALEPRGEWEGSRTKCQGFKPDLGNSAVRHYRGAFENVAMVEMRTQLAIERAGLVTLHLQPARRSSIPTVIVIAAVNGQDRARREPQRARHLDLAGL